MSAEKQDLKDIYRDVTFFQGGGASTYWAYRSTSVHARGLGKSSRHIRNTQHIDDDRMISVATGVIRKL